VNVEELRRAGQLLFDIAATLRRVPFNAETRPVHLRSLALKREVEAKRREPLREADDGASLIEQIQALDHEVARLVPPTRAA